MNLNSFHDLIPWVFIFFGSEWTCSKAIQRGGRGVIEHTVTGLPPCFQYPCIELYDLTSYNWHQFNELFLEEIHNTILQSFITAIFELSTKIVFIKACWQFRQDGTGSSQIWALPEEASGEWFSLPKSDPLGSHLGSSTKEPWDLAPGTQPICASVSSSMARAATFWPHEAWRLYHWLTTSVSFPALPVLPVDLLILLTGAWPLNWPRWSRSRGAIGVTWAEVFRSAASSHRPLCFARTLRPSSLMWWLLLQSGSGMKRHMEQSQDESSRAANVQKFQNF